MAEISIIVPVYNVESILCQCIDSILAQSFEDFVLILVDDGSPDNCGLICDKYAAKDKRIVVLHQENKGLSSARNAGIDYVMSKEDVQWITFVDSDDWIDEDYLKVLYESVSSKKCDCAVGGFVATSARDIRKKKSKEKPCSISVTPDELFGRVHTFGDVEIPVNIAWGKLYRKTLFANVRFPVGRINEDRFISHLIAFQCQSLVLIPQALYFYYLRENSISRSIWSSKKLNDIEATRGQIQFFEKHGAKRSLLIAVKDYYRITLRQLTSIRSLGNAEYRPYEKKARKELFRCVYKYSAILNLSADEKRQVLFALCPAIKWVIRKLDRLKKLWEGLR